MARSSTKGYGATLTLAGPVDLTALPNLPSSKERMAWFLGQVTELAPRMARPIIRSMLLPELEKQDSTSLVETLVLLQTTVLPWVIAGDAPDGYDAGPDYEPA